MAGVDVGVALARGELAGGLGVPPGPGGHWASRCEAAARLAKAEDGLLKAAKEDKPRKIAESLAKGVERAVNLFIMGACAVSG